MNVFSIKKPPTGDLKDFNSTFIPTSAALDENENIYILCYLRCSVPTLLWICDPSKNFWTRREIRLNISSCKLLCVRKDRLYVICYDHFQEDPFVYYLHYVDLKTQQLTFVKMFTGVYGWRKQTYWDLYDDQLYFYECDRDGTLKCCHVFNTSNGVWTTRCFSNVIVDFTTDFKICVSNDDVYVYGAFGVKKYEKDGSYEWFVRNPAEETFRKVFCRIGNYLCLANNIGATLFSTTEKKTIRFPINAQRILWSKNRLYLIQYYDGQKRFGPSLGCLSLDELRLEDIASRKINSCLKPETTHDDLKSKIGNLAWLFRSPVTTSKTQIVKTS